MVIWDSGSCWASIAAGHGRLDDAAQTISRYRPPWILDVQAEVQTAAGVTTYLSQAGSTVLKAWPTFQRVFPQLTIYPSAEAEGKT